MDDWLSNLWQPLLILFLPLLPPSRGFYLASRSSALWRLICFNTWGVNSLPAAAAATPTPTPTPAATPPTDLDFDWRSYYVSRPRVLMEGCYVAEMTYAREGERGFQVGVGKGGGGVGGEGEEEEEEEELKEEEEKEEQELKEEEELEKSIIFLVEA